jgi:kanamycin nucleotidyltransferase
MDHAERMRIAKELSEGFIGRYGDQILATGIRGSVARNEDDEYSNLNMVVVTNDPGTSSSKSLLLGPVAVDVYVVDRAAYLEDAATVGPWWPIRADQFTHSMAIHDPADFYRDLRVTYERFVEQAADQDFLRAEAANVVQAVTWAYKARSRAGHTEGMSRIAIAESTLRAILALGLRARFIFKNLTHAFRLAGDLPGSPPRFKSSIEKALLAGSDTIEAVSALEDAIESLLEAAMANGVPITAEGIDEFL